jgi:hypothetical protein
MLSKLLQRETYVPLSLIVISTVALCLGIGGCDFTAWSIAVGSYAALLTGGVLGSKKIEGSKNDDDINSAP